MIARENVDTTSGELVPFGSNRQALLFGALSKAQAAFPPIPRDRTVTVQTKTGGSYKFSYAPLDTILAAVRPALAENELAVAQQLTTDSQGRSVLETLLVHSGGGLLSGHFPIQSDGRTPQELGSLVTYLRRYALVALLGIASEEDDDGNAATGNKVSAQPKAPELATKGQKDHIHRLIDKLGKEFQVEESEIREGMQKVYGTQITTKLTREQAGEFITRLKKAAGEDE